MKWNLSWPPTAVLALATGLAQIGWLFPAQAQGGDACQLSPAERSQKSVLLQAALQGDATARQTYESLIAQQGDRLAQCRRQSALTIQATWLRLYPCDSKAGMVDALLDEIVNRGYNQVYVDVFSNGLVLLPAANNPTAWSSLLSSPRVEQVDLLAQVIQKGQQRGLKVYAWMVSLNFGQTYINSAIGQPTLARNGEGETTATAATKASLVPGRDLTSINESFIDPYNPQAKSDYQRLLQAILQRRPDGVLFDYIRYPKGLGPASIASKVKDLWIYGDASLAALNRRALNQKGQELLRRYLAQGYVSRGDISAVDQQFPTEKEPQWQTTSPDQSLAAVWNKPVAERLPALQTALWNLVVDHAIQGPVTFLSEMSALVQQQGIRAGAVFFPEGNQAIGKGFDSRLQGWPQFPASLEWHPMAYATCGNTSCIAAQIEKVINQAPGGTAIVPAITGQWGQATAERPALEQQMQILPALSRPVQAVSHFAFNWQDPQWERDRKFCRL
ncbi:MAG TPA: family 10 glycosylhydrolase [Coleofasciculaceae cyanobacterium]